MAGNLVESELTAAPAGRVRFGVATADDDAGIRRLLRENPMPGGIRITLEREPNYFADTGLPEETKTTIVAREGGRVVCTGSCTVRQRFVNGEPRRVGYLGGLRLDAVCAGRFDILRRGYEFFRELQSEAPADFYFTSIAADNMRARALLERGLPGMPRYEFIGGFVTILLPAKRDPLGGNDATDAAASGEKFIPFLHRHNSQYQFAPCWTAEGLAALAPLGLNPRDTILVEKDGNIAGCAALWDQSFFKQTVIRGYPHWQTLARPMQNLAASFTGGARLPAKNETLALAVISHMAAAATESETLFALLTRLGDMAAQRGIERLTLGFAADDPRLAEVRARFRGMEYHSRLYLVRWPDLGGSMSELDGGVLAPEVALL